MIIFILRIILFICKGEWVPPKTACSGMLLVNPFVYSIGGEAHYSGIVSGTKINHYKCEKIQSTKQQFEMKKKLRLND
ncbi:hypothetical protein T09_2179 [Trichinella sp. T9]|nr:hypothetical protein T09_2179 [Trichinella sp. T9]